METKKQQTIAFAYWADVISTRSLPEGGFSGLLGGRYRPEATAWAVFVLAASGTQPDTVHKGRERLRTDQRPAGDIVIEHSRALWPTALSILAWGKNRGFQKSHMQAVEFLLSVTGRHWKRNKGAPTGHDTALRGWPWIEGTHSWVEPTSLTLLALYSAGLGEHGRCGEARQMLLDRQLSQAGWNYGNTTVFGRELRPMPESTGMALNALAGYVERDAVEKSILYLKRHIGHLASPLSLSWGILGLSSWNERPLNSYSLLTSCFERQQAMGPYETTNIALLIAAALGERGLLSCLDNEA